jgi:O-methyltransferase domain
MYTKPHQCSSLQAKTAALEISLAPFTFQTAYSLWKLGILAAIGNTGDTGMIAEDIANALELSVYAVKVLLDLGLSSRLVWLRDEHYVLDKVGHFVLCDSMVHTNFDFTQDVCYQGLHALIDSIKSGTPEGLKVFGAWPTIYPALRELPEPAKTSWFNFDHFYSDQAFPEVLPVVFAKPVKQLFDIGGNTGKWTLQCLQYDPAVHVTIVDLPEQIETVSVIMQQKGLANRVSTYAANMLDNKVQLPKGADAILVSQFLDCFSEAEILSILQRIVAVMQPHTTLYILELFYDRQVYEAAAFAINCTSIYFTCMANGNSRMYHSKDMLKLIQQAGLYVDDDIDHIAAGHTLLCCKRKG